MSLIPPPPAVSAADIEAWAKLKKDLDLLKWQESELRKKIFGAYFTTPKEGTNNYEIGNGYVLKGVYVIDRKVDQPGLSALQTMKVKDGHHILRAAGYKDDQIVQMDQEALLFTALHISTDNLIKYKPELSVTEYRKLTAEQMVVVNMFIDSKPGSPQMKLEPTPAKKAELDAAAAPQAQPPLTYIPPPPRVG